MSNDRELEIVGIDIQVYQVGPNEDSKVYHVELTYTNKGGYWSKWFTTKKELESFHNGLLAATAYELPNFEIPDAATILSVPMTEVEPTCAGCGSFMVRSTIGGGSCFVCPNCGEKLGQS
jgi:hypothetical protein